MMNAPTNSNTSYPHSFTLTVGDWSGDGHSQTATQLVYCTHSAADVQKFYKKGCALIGKYKGRKFDLTDQVCAEYEDCTVPQELVTKLTSLGFEFEKVEPSGGVDVWHHEFVEIYMFLAQKGSEHAMQWTPAPDTDNIDIGGYGLFS